MQRTGRTSPTHGLEVSVHFPLRIFFMAIMSQSVHSCQATINMTPVTAYSILIVSITLRIEAVIKNLSISIKWVLRQETNMAEERESESESRIKDTKVNLTLKVKATRV